MATDEQTTTPFDFALQVFNTITPVERQPEVKVAELIKKVDITDPDAMKYLSVQDNDSLKELNSIFAESFKEILEDDKITLSDIPAFLRLIHNVSLKMNDFNEKKTAVFEVSRLTIIAFLRVTISILCEMILTDSQFKMLFEILDIAFDLVTVKIEPIIKKSGWFNSCMGKST